MSSILNKSNHPVVVKKIPIEVWTLRQEIEAAIKHKIDENGGNAENLDISDIQNFYTMEYSPEEEDEIEEGDSADEMLKAIQDKSEEESEGDSAEENSEDSADTEKAEASSEDDQEKNEEAQKLAEEVLEGEDGPHDENKAKEFNRVFPTENINRGFIFLSDLNMHEALVFTRETYTTGTNVVIQLGITKPFTLCAEVISSFSVNRNSRVISEQKPNFRVQTRLQFKFPGERTLLRDFLKSVEPNVPPPPSKLKKPASEEEEEDEFDDLGF